MVYNCRSSYQTLYESLLHMEFATSPVTPRRSSEYLSKGIVQRLGLPSSLTRKVFLQQPVSPDTDPH
ncbi:MAG: hypothetical protein ACE5KV_09215, partial [Thermoplasmata archaeon]